MKKTILAIETSCDDTGIAIVEAEGGFLDPKFKVLKNLVSSQIKIHRPFGGVVPNLAKREHIKNLPILYRKIFGKWQMANGYKPDIIAVTVGPGLEPALWTGINFAKTLTSTDDTQTNAEKSQFKSVSSRFKSAKLVGVNHLEGHLYSFLLSSKNLSPVSGRLSQIFPAIVLLVSGGHTALLFMKDIKTWKKLGETRDDAAGEAFDKVARMFKLPYPGGPEIEHLALSMPKGEKQSIPFPRPMLHDKSYDFSFSGLKTSVFYYLRDNRDSKLQMHPNLRIQNKTKNKLASSKKPFVDSNKFAVSNRFRADVAASFQEAVIEVLISKTTRAVKEFSAEGGSASGGGATKSIILCGGVAANKALRKKLKQSANNFGINFIAPEMEYNNDNAAMIAAAGYFAYLKGKKSARGGSALGGLPMKADGDLNL